MLAAVCACGWGDEPEIAFSHAFPGLTLDIGLNAPTPGTTVLFGRSGVGKSTVIAALAGLIRPTVCRIVIDGVTLADTERSLSRCRSGGASASCSRMRGCSRI